MYYHTRGMDAGGDAMDDAKEEVFNLLAALLSLVIHIEK